MADSGRVRALPRRRFGPAAAQLDPGITALRLLETGGGGTDHTWDADFWVSPLPPEGPVTFVTAWPELGAAESRAELDAAPLLAAARRAVELWPEDAHSEAAPTVDR